MSVFGLSCHFPHTALVLAPIWSVVSFLTCLSSSLSFQLGGLLKSIIHAESRASYLNANLTYSKTIMVPHLPPQCEAGIRVPFRQWVPMFQGSRHLLPGCSYCNFSMTQRKDNSEILPSSDKIRKPNETKRAMEGSKEVKGDGAGIPPKSL